MRLKVGQLAPQFTMQDITGKQVSLAQYRGRKILVSFNRAAVCPLCNLRTWHMIHRYPEYRWRGLEVIAFFESSPQRTHQYLDQFQAPYPIIADLDHKVYSQYGLENSLLGVLRGRLARGSDYREASQHNINAGNVRSVLHAGGAIARMPADFLIGPDGRIAVAYYGKDAGDFMLFSEIDRFLIAE
ncbi:MAG: peroxiredoxin-like family protein [Ktedonobacterales bacterium]